MKIERIGPPFEAVIVYDTYSNEELSDIWNELAFLTNSRVMRAPSDTGSAVDEHGKPIKNNKSVFLQKAYYFEKISPILTYSKKLFSDQVSSALIEINPVHELITKVNRNSTLLSYYEDSDEYPFHKDECIYSSVTYLFKEPRMFSGGDISFKINNEVVTMSVQSNMSIVFPSVYVHGVSPVSMDESIPEFSGYGRYCISQFMNFTPR